MSPSIERMAKAERRCYRASRGVTRRSGERVRRMQSAMRSLSSGLHWAVRMHLDTSRLHCRRAGHHGGERAGSRSKSRAAGPGGARSLLDAVHGNRQFKANPRMIARAEGCHYITTDGRRVLDGLSGLWCCGAGHDRPEIADAVARQLRTLDYSPAFQFGHPLAFELANKIKALTPAGLDYVFFTNSGSEAADTSLKIARAYWRQKGPADEDAADRPREGLSRRQLRRHLGRRHRRRTANCSARASRPTTCRTRCCPRTSFTRGMPETRRGARRRAGRAGRTARRVEHRRRDRRAVRRLGRRVAAAEGLPRSGCARSATSTTSC